MENSGFLQPHLSGHLAWLYVESIWWTYFGLAGNALFTCRLVIQWIKSERSKQLVIPTIYWHLSFWGSVVSLIYALHVDKLPVILGYLFLPVMYFRNLRILGKTARPEQAALTNNMEAS